MKEQDKSYIFAQLTRDGRPPFFGPQAKSKRQTVELFNTFLLIPS